ncbi:hypothetical protein FA13DRAFT_778849 [Coprinellus micaceus]|uniref:MYND-type domain-containing protein n=1 Tax=Coprinellus micaceus TaxID=71717 RepID=A0A4Y7T420_COPMI|nr:hypothetical protein FA13DRAFT_778849 [Coprinellus micaceus]
MVRITTAIGSLMSANNKLRDAILQEKLSAGFADVLYSVTFPSLKPAGVDAMPAIVVMLEQISEWSSNAPFPLAMRSMKGLITNGLVQIIGEYRKTRHLLADFDREKLDRTILFALSRAIEASMFPKTAFYFYKDALFHPYMKPSVIDSFEETVLGTAATFFEVYPLLLPQHRTHTCDNLDHYDLGLDTIPAPYTKGQSCSQCHTVVYCSEKCQAEDWKARHRQECQSMRLEYSERKQSKSWSTHHHRTFHLAALVHKFADSTLLWNAVNDRARGPLNERMVTTMNLACVGGQFRWSPLEEYVDRTTPFLPKHKVSRFEELVSWFKRAEPHVKVTNDGISLLSLELVNGVFFFGDLELNYAVLMRRLEDTGPEGTDKFAVAGYLTFICPRTERKNASTTLDPSLQRTTSEPSVKGL